MRSVLLFAQSLRFLTASTVACAVSVMPALCESSKMGSTVKWSGSVGAWISSGPTYSGSNESELIWRPVIDVVWSDHLFFSTRRGIGYWVDVAPIPGEARAGVSLAPSFDDLDLDDDARLSGLQSVDEGLEARALFEWSIADFEFGMSAAQEISGKGHGGRRLEVTGAYGIEMLPEVSASIGPFFVWGNATYSSALYGVSSLESNRTGLPAFSIDSGWERAGTLVELSIDITERASFGLEWESSALLGDFAASPIVQSTNQNEITITSIFKF